MKHSPYQAYIKQGPADKSSVGRAEKPGGLGLAGALPRSELTQYGSLNGMKQIAPSQLRAAAQTSMGFAQQIYAGSVLDQNKRSFALLNPVDSSLNLYQSTSGIVPTLKMKKSRPPPGYK